ncbi:L-serine ammonia-lyase [Leucobacter sp. UCMA 4100]|uniref:L-serine ammonia-lyase n=1 Tax=Leucobacter sp. UCMA 4100 TaxID=2810534 RepID=UPI0022EB2C2D|nr:L-serine ammonia-lyase [Leucobacter sp. UCMA 4100]MDA3146540.1 L-serine ammonia-lyase [Leucobacter sp. UCMA 4100]
MAVSVFDLFKVGIGPSSSHTVGPMRAAQTFAQHLESKGALETTTAIAVDLYGSLAATGAGHGTFTAVMLGLEGYAPDTVLPDEVEVALERMQQTGVVRLGDRVAPAPTLIDFRIEDMTQRPLTVLPFHTNGMTFKAFDERGETLLDETYFSVGGGFIVREGTEDVVADRLEEAVNEKPFPFTTGAELLEHCERNDMTFASVMLANELVKRDETEVREGLTHIWRVMEGCKDAALTRTGVLPGGLNVRRRAPEWHRKLSESDPDRNPIFWQEWVNLVALAVNEENATGGRVVTAPTNGAAGIIPAVLFYATHYTPGARTWNEEEKQAVIADFLLAAGAVGVLYKEQASISGAEVGCQGEVGSASSMAAAGLAQVLGGSPQQVENAAEIAMEHNLGLTCDPIGGLVQIPCIERNAIAASKAINAAKMALMGDGDHHVTLDEVIITMRETGKDMSSKYKETAMGGLAVNVIEC